MMMLLLAFFLGFLFIFGCVVAGRSLAFRFFVDPRVPGADEDAWVMGGVLGLGLFGLGMVCLATGCLFLEIVGCGCG